jgi:SET domain-containing protein
MDPRGIVRTTLNASAGSREPIPPDPLTRVPDWVMPPRPGLALHENAMGRAVYTRSGHPAGERLLEYWGPRATFAEAAGRPHDHIMEVGDGVVFLPTGGLDDFLNHSCDPNCRLDYQPDGRVFLVALRDIAAGEELSFDYATTTTADGVDAFPDWRLKCTCGTANCRGDVSCAEELPMECLRRYAQAGALAPHVLRRVMALLAREHPSQATAP